MHDMIHMMYGKDANKAGSTNGRESAEVSMDRPVHGRTWTDMDMDGRTDVHGLL
jgi:hypothetical protein